MKKILKSVLSLVVTICLVTIPSQSLAATLNKNTYVALGDSISTGYGLEDRESDSFVSKIAKEYNLNLTNLSEDGMNTTIMLNLLNSNDENSIAYKEAIKNADLITVSIGGNDLFQPLMNIMKQALNLNSDATSEEVQEAIKNNSNALVNICTQLQNSETSEILKNQLEIFSTKFPQIVNTIKALNPNAKIMIQTIYNPLNDSNKFMYLATIIDPFFQAMNKVIDEASVIGYEVVDVYTEFKLNDIEVSLTNIEDLDVHPNINGNDAIFNLHKEILDNNNNPEPSYIEVKELSGIDRYETAIKVSQERFENGEASSVILVGKDAIVDGLASAPLAITEEASILFADVNSLNDETIQEMLRVLGQNFNKKTVYIVGGESKISKNVELMLAQTGVKVERLYGEDRYITSIEVAKQLNSNSEVAFVVGGNGEADAMSISAKAAELKAPILVLDNGKLNEEAKALLENKEIYIIGGENCISDEIKLELDKLDLNKNSKRIAGIDRKETNAKVISKFYESEDVLELFVAKDGYVGGKDKLVDALAAAPLAAIKLSPILLTTDGLNEHQQGIVEELNNVEKITKVGNGISENTMEFIVNLLKNK